MASRAGGRPWRIEGPIPQDPIFTFGNYDLADRGYSAEEYFLSGAATSFRQTEIGLEVEATADYCTRLVVARPADPAEFSGTVGVEWLNVSGGWDACPDWMFVHRHVLRSGAAWVCVSAQRAGIDGGGVLGEGGGVRSMAPARYERIDLPGDAFAFDIFTHAGEAVRAGDGVLGDLEATCVIAVGESQSAIYLTSYVNHVDREAQGYDAFLIHSRAAKGASLSGWQTPEASEAGEESELATTVSRFGEDAPEPIVEARVPVITLQTETDLVDLYSARARCPDGSNTRLWEIAGTAHFDIWGLVVGYDDDGTLPIERLAALSAPTSDALGMTANEPFNAAPQQHYVAMAAFATLERWVRERVPAPHAPAIETSDDGKAVTVERDALGIARGGIRTPWVDVPTAVFSGEGAEGASFARLFGVTRPFDRAQLSDLYPGGIEDYLARFDAAAREAHAAGFLLEDDLPEILALARARWPT